MFMHSLFHFKNRIKNNSSMLIIFHLHVQSYVCTFFFLDKKLRNFYVIYLYCIPKTKTCHG